MQEEGGGVEGDSATQEDILGRIQGVDDSLALLEGEVSHYCCLSISGRVALKSPGAFERNS